MGKFKPWFELELPREYKPDERKAIAAEIIDFIINRTEEGKDKDNKSFARYSKAYAKSKGQTNVDLTFSGEMLAAISLLQDKSGKIRIGVDGDDRLLGKVEGNILGTYGNDRPVTKGRDFLGIKKEDLDAILANYPIDDKEERLNRVAEVKALDIVARDIAMRSGIDVEADDE